MPSLKSNQRYIKTGILFVVGGKLCLTLIKRDVKNEEEKEDELEDTIADIEEDY